MRDRDAETALLSAGFVDLEPRVVALLILFADALRDHPLSRFEDCNEHVGTANGLASGIVRAALETLAERGHLAISEERGVQLTARGLAAARAAGIGGY